MSLSEGIYRIRDLETTKEPAFGARDKIDQKVKRKSAVRFDKIYTPFISGIQKISSGSSVNKDIFDGLGFAAWKEEDNSFSLMVDSAYIRKYVEVALGAADKISFDADTGKVTITSGASLYLGSINIGLLITALGIGDEDSNLGTFTGTIITDDTTIKNALQELETDLEALQTAVGISAEAIDMGTFTGTIITDNVTAKTALQELETDAVALQTLTGVAAEAVNLGSFTGSIITDNQTIKAAMQELETEMGLNSTHRGSDGTDHSLLGATAGTASASKALIVDANKDIDLGTGDLSATHLIGGGKVVGGILGISSATHYDALNVTSVRVIRANTISNNIVIGGLANGVNGQVIHIFKYSTNNTLTIENNEATGTQKIYTNDAADIVLGAGNRGGVTLVYYSSWYVISE